MLNGDLIWEVAGKSYRSRDGWEMTEQGRAFAAQLRTRDRRSRRRPLFRSDCYRAWRDDQAHVDRKTTT
jgi:hypothetical protein